ncbi:hypothetical protein [Paenibacillus ehimensis]|uniref:Uncharacterized protein n=1 Tax=Paenibacillus ehimensis TaxID=79264 RepID=A0ABT8VAA4_9BACL|nr:hypothetical protein [Paenibacillus ehimensis]MDO3677895.1 hypothetical protein [Paenibacillus ehimensis]
MRKKYFILMNGLEHPRLEEDLERPVQIIEGCEWEPTTASYDVSPEIMHLYEKTRQKAFSILEPEADEENKKHPELYGKRCIYCRIWTRDFSKQKCLKCGNGLLKLPLNEWDYDWFLFPNAVNQLKAVDAAGEDYDDFVEILEDLGKLAALRR